MRFLSIEYILYYFAHPHSGWIHFFLPKKIFVLFKELPHFGQIPHVPPSRNILLNGGFGGGGGFIAFSGG